MNAMLSSCIQKWRAEFPTRRECQMCEVNQLSMSENAAECDSCRPVERARFWQQRSSLLVPAMFVCLALRVPLNYLTDFTYLAVVSNRTVHVEYGIGDYTFGQKMARGVYSYSVPLAEVVGGFVAVRRGHPCLFVYGAAATSMLALLSPALLKASTVTLACLLLVVRLADALFVRNLELVWGRWVPVDRKWVVAICYSSLIWGDLVAGILRQWIPALTACPPVYYILGFTGLAMCITWWVAVNRVQVENSTSLSKTRRKTTGFCRLVTSLPVVALIVAVMASKWSFFTVTTISPIFFSNKRDFDEEPLKSLLLGQHLVSLLILYCFIAISTSEGISTRLVRKSYIFVSLAVNGGLLILLFFRYSLTETVALVTTVHVCSAVAYNTSLMNVFDIAPRFSPIIIGILTAITSACAPLVISVVLLMVKDGFPNELKKMFFISSGVALAGAFTYLGFGSVKLQKWAAEEDRR